MNKQEQIDGIYLRMAMLNASQSKAIRKKVGAVIVTSVGVMIPGYNGTVSGHDNCCEDEILVPIDDSKLHLGMETKLVTKPTVIHAESNCILKAAKEGVSVVGSTCYVTLLPCIQCSAMLCQAGVKRVVYAEEYRDDSGIEVLKTSGVIVEKYKGEL